MKAGGFQEAAAIAGTDGDVEHVAFPIEGERHLDAGLAERPEAAVEGGKRGTGTPATARTTSPAASPARLAGPSPARPTSTTRSSAILHRIESEPGSRRGVDPSEGEKIVEDRLQMVDRHDHVERHDATARALVLKLERADAEEVAARPDQGRCRPNAGAQAR